MNTKIEVSGIQNNAKTHASSNIQAAAIHKLEIARLYLFTSSTFGRFVKLKKHTAFVSLRGMSSKLCKFFLIYKLFTQSALFQRHKHMP